MVLAQPEQTQQTPEMTTEQATLYVEQTEQIMANLDLAWAAGDYANTLKKKADITAVKLREARKKVQEQIRDVNKALWQQGVAPADPAECVQLFESRRTITAQIADEVKKKGYAPEIRRNYRDAANLYMQDARKIREEQRGEPITPSKYIDPNMMARIIVERAAKRKK